ncbi:hypothetical protein MycrhDRAFT_5738 [Mycolicibacterium rhodesiae JS60]|nr:hypothetical protein MycrhDRAFT_5738 [Mycolicibacterium rhodesiae JS60]
MTVTSQINRAKDQLDTAGGELQRAQLLVNQILGDSDQVSACDYDQLMHSLVVAAREVREVRSSL